MLQLQEENLVCHSFLQRYSYSSSFRFSFKLFLYFKPSHHWILTGVILPFTFLIITLFERFIIWKLFVCIQLKIVSQQKDEINWKKCSCNNLLRLSTWINKTWAYRSTFFDFWRRSHWNTVYEFIRRRRLLTDESREPHPKSVNALYKVIMRDHHVIYEGGLISHCPIIEKELF